MKAWEQLPEESSQAYRAARAYFEMGSGRTIAGVQEQLKGPSEAPVRPPVGPRKAPGTLKRWAKQFRWKERAQAFDQNLDAVGDRAREAERANQATVLEQRRAAVAEVEWRISQNLWLRLDEMLQFPIGEATTETRVSEDGRTTTVIHHHPTTNWRPRDVAALARAASDLQRLSAGLPTRAVVPSHSPDATPPVDQAQADADNRVPPDLVSDWLDLAAGKALRHQGLDDAQPEDY